MRTIFYIVQKEFIQVFRNRMMVPIIFLMPVIQLLILSFAVTYEIKEIRLYITDNDNSVSSRSLLRQFKSSPFYRITGEGNNAAEGMENIRKGKVHQMICILPGFEENLVNGAPARVQVINDAINGSAAALMNAYTVSIIGNYNAGIIAETAPEAQPAVKINWLYWFNPELDYKTYMIPGILVLLVTIIGMFLAGMNVVREKEIGTIEQINVTPIKKYQFIAGKLIPFWIIALFDLAAGLLMARLFFDIPILGNIPLIFLVASVYLIVVMGLGLFISTITNTQQQSMFMAWFFLVIFILMSGLFTPVESMPQWAKNINVINPIAYFIRMIRMIMLKGSDFPDIVNPLIYLTFYGITILSLAIWRYRKTT
ncbi:ABC transporter permease [Lentimicrobium sp.]|uniref:ABC transporter permease n=1 Tax=Lentimicrobium sp. TaxID=2034841 RepID=UPI00345E6DEC